MNVIECLNVFDLLSALASLQAQKDIFLRECQHVASLPVHFIAQSVYDLQSVAILHLCDIRGYYPGELADQVRTAVKKPSICRADVIQLRHTKMRVPS